VLEKLKLGQTKIKAYTYGQRENPKQNFKVMMGETLNLNITHLRHLNPIKSSKVASTKNRQICKRFPILLWFYHDQQFMGI